MKSGDTQRGQEDSKCSKLNQRRIKLHFVTLIENKKKRFKKGQGMSKHQEERRRGGKHNNTQ